MESYDPAFYGLPVTGQLIDLDPALPGAVPIGTSEGIQTVIGSPRACTECVDIDQQQPLSPAFLADIQNSGIAQGYQTSLLASGWTLDFAAGMELDLTFGDPTLIPGDARFAMIPVIDNATAVQGLYIYSGGTQGGGPAEIGAFMRPFTSDIDPNQETIRLYGMPDLTCYVDIEYDFNVDDGCNPGVRTTPVSGGLDGINWDCVPQLVATVLHSFGAAHRLIVRFGSSARSAAA